MNKIKRSGRLLKATFAVLLREKKLLLFPMIATGLAVVIALFFIVPIALYPTGHPFFSVGHWSDLGNKLAPNFQPGHHAAGQPVLIGHNGLMPLLSGHWWIMPLFAIVYFVSMFLATFSNVAFYHEIMQALNGQPVSIRRGFRFARSRWQAVLMWSLFAGLVGYVINAIEQRLGFLGRFIMGFIGMAWSVACIFVIPTLVRDAETVNPLKLLRTSAGTLKCTWGELVIGFVGMELAFGLIFILLLIASALTGGLGTALLCLCFHWSGWWALPVILGEFFLFASLLGMISNVANPVYRCALFVYATEGVIPEPFDKELLDSAWKVK